MDRDNAQLSQSSQQVPFDPNSFVFVTYNGDARAYGLEVSVEWQIKRCLATSRLTGFTQHENPFVR